MSQTLTRAPARVLADPEVRFAPLEAKLLAPAPRPGLVVRKPLIDRVRAASAPVVCVTAPAGYGKTTLLAHWGEADARPFAWVSLEASDNDPVELVTAIAIALNRVEPLGGAVFQALSVRAPEVEDAVLPRLGKALAGLTHAVVLVLDDVHLLESARSLGAVAVLVRHLPPGSQLVMASRSEPALQLGTLRAERALLELGTADLALDERGADALLRAAGVQLGPDDLRHILERTEGWPAGLYLAALALKSRGPFVTPVRGFAGDDRFIVDYFGEQVLSRLAPSVARFLTRTSVLDRLSDELCDAILESSGSAAKLRKLERSNLFLIPLDRKRVWYRYHTLFREMLRRRLHDEDGGLEVELHQRAAEWHAEHGEPVDAITHALEAGDVHFAGDVLWSHVVTYCNQGRSATLARWLALFGDDQIAEYPPLALAAAWVALGVDAHAVEHWATAAANGAHDGPLSDGSATVAAAVSLLRAIVGRNGVTEMAEDAAAARALESPDSPWQAVACFAEGVAARLAGEREEARESFVEGESIAAVHHLGAVQALCRSQLALIAAAEGSLDAAASLASLARADAEEVRMHDHGAMAPVFAVSALVLAERGRFEAARWELVQARRLLAGRAQASPWFAVEARLLLARASLLLGDANDAASLLTDARRLLRSTADLGVLADELAELTVQLESFRVAGVTGRAALTPAEVRLLHVLPTHLSFREIGDLWHVSRHTVKTQANSIYRKLAVSKRGDAVERARALGLIDP